MFKEIKENIIFYGFPALLLLTVYFLINSFAYLGIYPFCYIGVHGNVLSKNEGVIRSAIHLIKEKDPASYSDLCKYIDVIKEQKCTTRDYHIVTAAADPDGCYVKGSRVIYLDVKKFNPNYRILPKKYITNSAVDIFSDYVVTFAGMNYKNIPDDVTIFVLHDKRLAESFRTWFKFIYDHCPKPKK